MGGGREIRLRPATTRTFPPNPRRIEPMNAHSSRPREPETLFRSRQLLSGIAVLALLVGCDVPTEPPEFETRWIVPAEQTRFGVGELLPGDVSLTPDSSAFIVDFDPVSYQETLGALCPACALADGQTIPKPAFVGSAASGIALPADVVSFEVVGGQVEVEILNGLNFDPIRPADGAFGTIELQITDESDDEVLGTLVIDGNDVAFPPGGTLVRTVELMPATVEGDIGSSATIDSPLGDPVTLDASLPFSVTATPSNVRVGVVEIDVSSQSVTLDPVSFDFEDVDTTLTNRVEAGSFILDVVNPFGVSADFDLTISGPTIVDIQKSASIDGSAESSVVIGFTGAEIRSFLGEPGVTLSGGAVVDPGAANVTVSPGDELILDAALDLTLRIGG